ncbi:DNA methyltransferase [Corynebacterium sp. HMSC05H05]|uniref:class I SAM-dependent DNA methyltransferase n=1 Tax=Corynebacterium sp. HMSC05H05 TaxID=1581119 RepID=UPI0008A437A6|nr:DNA methyltransferase [Corynebacterium sp. HMSC05H05]OFT55964.1 DNA methyltransferase [Corynebacterium sp. HMSC05H05]
MKRLNYKAIEERVAHLANRAEYNRDFIFDLLLAYGRSKGNVTRLRNGSLNVADDPEREVAQKNIVYFRETEGDLLAELEWLRVEPTVVKFSPRFIIVTDYVDVLAFDTKTTENRTFPIRQIDQHFTFFLPWAGMEKTQYTSESHADVKAAERMGKLFDELASANPDMMVSDYSRHGLNVFFTRLLFCFFAEDTGIFEDNQFTNAVASQTLGDGSDTEAFLRELFEALDEPDQGNKPAYLAGFPYVNGRLFRANSQLTVPRFSAKAREALIDLGTLKWQDINPDIFGSMFQAIVEPSVRSNLGQHYTSVPNILKTIEPLFLDDLREEFEKAYSNPQKLQRLLDRIAAIKVFDPACGSGNFLVIAYKELRRLEHAILQRQAELARANTLFDKSRINIENFYGIEIDDFAVEVAILSLWIAKHQMNREFEQQFKVAIPLIPLKETGQIRAGNATRIDWNAVCPNNGEEEIYLISNPPYVGSSMQTAEQKSDFAEVFGDRPFSKNLDYISLWFVKGSDYIRGTNAELAFVTTNSVSQGDHVGLMFPTVLANDVEIGYAHTSFKWENNAKHNAGVTVSVISLRNKKSKPKWIFDGDTRCQANNINAYLADAADVIVLKRSRPFRKDFPPMLFGSKPTDGGHLILSPAEKRAIVEADPRSERFVKRYVGASDYIQDVERYCLWVAPEDYGEARTITPIEQRLERVERFRLQSKAASTVEFAALPYRFKQVAYKPSDSIIVPRVSSESRAYIPMGYLGPDVVISDAAFAVYDAEPWLFALLTSQMHMAWVRAVGGKMKTDFRYSNTIVYNNFPVPEIVDKQKAQLTETALRILDVREYHCERTLAELYDRDSMPRNLREAHEANDALVDSLYSSKPYASDEDRLADLFALYEEMIAAEEAAKPVKRKRKTTKKR